MPPLSQCAYAAFRRIIFQGQSFFNIKGKLLTTGSFLLLICFNAYSQTGNPTVVTEQGKLIRAPEALTTLGADLFGDKVNLYNGALEFIQTDVSLPGNNSLSVSVGRRTSIGSSGNRGNGLFRNWDLDIPRIYGTFATQTGWQRLELNGQPSTLRCTNFGAPPAVYRPGSTTNKFRSTEYWHGNMLYVPGQGEQEILRRNTASAVATPADGASTPLVTKNLWMVRCLPVLASAAGNVAANETGEGFLAISPDGTQYRFDWLVSRPVDSLSKAFETPSEGKFTLDRVEVSIFPTQITDRFGNTVYYDYDTTDKWKLKRIRSADGKGNRDRTLTFEYAAGTHLVQAVSDGKRTWTYSYGVGENGTPILTAVTLPDNSRWNLAGLDGKEGEPGLAFLYIGYGHDGGSPEVQPAGEICDAQPTGLNSPVATGRIIHPSGAEGSFTVTPTSHARNGVPRLCYTDNPLAPAIAYYPQYYDLYSLTNKTITGPGLPSMSWNTNYDTWHPGWADCTSCAEPSTVTVTDPNGIQTRYSFGSTFGIDEGMLKQVDVGWNGSTALRSTTTQYNQSFTTPLGFSDQDRGDAKVNTRLVPVGVRTHVQDGVSFTWQVPSNADFDSFGRPRKVIRSSTLGYSRTELTEYSDNLSKWILGQVRSVTDAGTGRVEVRNEYNPVTGVLEKVTRFGLLNESRAYNPDGTLAMRSDGLNQATSYGNYKRGIAQSITYANGKKESLIVNDIGRIDSRTDETLATTTYGYDGLGRLASIAYPVGDSVAWNATSSWFNQMSNSEFDLLPGHWRQVIVTGTAVEVNYYDAFWRPVYTERWDDADRANTMRIVKRQYDFAGRPTYTSYPKRSYGEISAGVYHEYDALGRPTVTSTISELGTLYDGFGYGGGDFQKVYTDAKGHNTYFTYQAFDEPSDAAISSIRAPEGVAVDISRDIFGKPQSITRSGNGRSATRRYVYDSYERLCKTIEPETGATIQDHDAANNLSWRASGLTLLSTSNCDFASVAAAKKASFHYDALNRLFSTNYGDGSPGITRTYTADGLPETISSGGAVWTNTYNKRRLNESESLAYGGVTYRIGRDYDANGSLAKLTYPDNSAVAYSPNALGEPRQVGTYASGLAYHPSGTVQGFRYGNGITHSMAQNMRGLPEWSEDAGVLKDKYEYDQNANVASIADWQEGITNRGLTYDGLDRLTRANAPSLWGDAFYTYDALDNLSSARLTAGGTARTTTHTVDPATNLLMGVSNSAGAGYNLGYQYDSQGNIVQRGTQTFRFDLANRMTSAVGKGTYLYDGLGHRVSVVGTDGVNRVQVYSQGGQLLYANTSGSALANGTKYVYLHNHVIAEVNGTAVQYDHTDGLGSPVARTDAAARLISRTRYEPYGATAAGAESVIGFAGHVTAADLGLVYMQQRYYDPIAGRFLSIDPVTTDANTGGSFNRYAYGANSPYKYVDPDGRDVVFSVDTKAAGGNGHTTLYFQDKGAAWHAYNQGAAGDAKSSGNLGFLSGQNAKAGVSIEGVSKDSVPKDGLRISTSAKQDGLIATNAEQSAAAHNSGKVEYNLYSNNCTDAAVGVVNSSGAGITVSNPATTVKPNSWIKEVKEDPKAVVRKEESK